MNYYKQHLLAFICGFLLVFSSCSKEDTEPEKLPLELNADNTWMEGEISPDEIIWYKVIADESFTILYVEWAEADYHGQSRSYTSDIKVSAYQLDGLTPYFENIDIGYGQKTRSFPFADEPEVLLKVEINDITKPGTYAIRSTGTGDEGDIVYHELNPGIEWTDTTISEGESHGYLVDCSDHIRVKIIWAEADSPEEGYSADIKGTVLYLDGESPYTDLGNGKEIVNKNKSHSDDPKTIEVDPTEKKFKIHISVNTVPGTYALKIEPV